MDFWGQRLCLGAYWGDVRQHAADEGWLPRWVPAISEARERSSEDTLKAGASELLDVYPLLRAFIIAAYGACAEMCVNSAPLHGVR